MFPARLNWETFASAKMFSGLARPLGLRYCGHAFHDVAIVRKRNCQMYQQ